MDPASMEDAAVFGISEGGSMAALFAATYPERCRALVLYGAFASFQHWDPGGNALQGFTSIRLGAAAGAYLFLHPRARKIRYSNAGGGSTSVLALTHAPLPH
jgi:pimeloyl-ACP methyl ester carboxylesterase